MVSRSIHSVPSVQTLRPVRIKPSSLKKLQLTPSVSSLGKETYDQLATRAPNFQSICFGIKPNKEQLFGMTLTKTASTVSTTKIVLGSTSSRKGNAQSADEPKSRILLNLESLLKIEEQLEYLVIMGKKRTLETVFNKSTEWWDETAQIQSSMQEFFFVTYWTHNR